MPAISPSPLLIYYIIYTTDTAHAAAWLAANPSGVVTAGPATLAASEGLTPNYSPTVMPDPSGCWFQYFRDGSNANIASLDVHAEGGIVDPNAFYNIITPPNTDWDPIAWKWQGSIFPWPVPTGGGGGGSIQSRYWACGFELGAAGNANLATPHNACCPAASRATDGYGFAVSNGGSLADISQSTTAPTGTGTLPNGSWERLYIRPWVYPNQGEVAIWSCHGSLEGIDAAYLTMNTSGALTLRNVGNAGTPGTVFGTSSVLPLNTWAKLDILFKFRAGTNPGQFALMINGAVAFSATIPLGTGSGLGAGGSLHQSSKVGSAQTFAVGGLTPTSYKYDLDDWVGQLNPTAPGLPATPDSTAGTHIRLLNVTGVAAAGAWTGDYRGMAGNPPGGASQMQTSTPSSRLILTTDFVNLPQVGVASVMVQAWPNAWPPTTPAKVGYRINGGAVVQSTGTVNGFTSNFCGQLFNFASAQTDTATIDLTIDKDAAGAAMILGGLFGAAEYIGWWGPEDIVTGTTPTHDIPPRTGLQNAPYPEIAAVATPVTAMAWAQARQGTYVGNAVGQDVSVGVPFQWLWIRNLSTNVTEYWWSSQCTVHRNLSGGSGGVDVDVPLPFPPNGAATSFHVSGNSGNVNANGVTYQWVAFSDPNSRFLLNGAVSWPSAVASAVNALQDPAFTPTCVFTAQEDIGSSISGFFYKGPGNPTDTANPLTGADVAAVLTFSAGTITTKPTAHSKAPQMAYGAWRTSDGTGASGAVDCKTYTGDGLASRNIAVALNGNSPLFAFGIAHTVGSYFRDPSHTALDSTQVGAGIVSNAIIGGGLNYVTVGAALNVAGRVYDVFVLAGSPYGGSWTPSVDPGTGVPPSPPPVPPVTPPPGPKIPDGPPPVVVPPHGWWKSDVGFRGDVEAFGDSRPANPRSWHDFAGFASGSAAMLGGSIAAVFRNRLVYAASGYVVGTAAPPIRIFDGAYDRELTTIPPTASGPALAVVAVLVANGTIYLSTWDSGNSMTTWTGRVFALDLDSATLTPIGGAFPAGQLPYALAWLNSALWCGTNRRDPTVPGKVFTMRPDVDTAWTEDYNLATVALGGVAALTAFHGTLYVGTTGKLGTFGAILKRAADGTYSIADTGTAGAAVANNGYLAFAVFLDALYAGYWNNDTTPIATIRRSVDGVTWTTAYTGAAGTLRPFIALTADAGWLYAIGGGLGLTAAIVATQDGASWIDLTPQLPETDRTALPAVGVVVL
jgi:hypothetical protein